MQAVIRIFGAWIAAVLTTYVLCAATSQLVVTSRVAAGEVDVPLGSWLGSIVDAVSNMTTLLPVIGIAFAVGFTVAAGLKRILTPLAGVAYPIAGAAAQLAPLLLMRNIFGIFPLLGAQTSIGLILQILAGAAGGYVFARLIRGSATI
ncbi:MAG: hypothetical protein AAGA69_10595 [Pseudomonadota bacterium]